MTAAPPESKQRLICETNAPAGGWPSAPEGADPEIARLRQRLDRAEWEARAARGWAWMMFLLALTSGVAVSVLAVRVADRAAEERGIQALLRTLKDQQPAQRSPINLSAMTPALTAPLSKPAAPPKPAAVVASLKPVRPVSPARPGPALSSASIRPASITRPVAATERSAAVSREPLTHLTAPLPSVASSSSSFRTESPAAGRPGAAGAAVQRPPLRKPVSALARTHQSRRVPTRVRKPRRPLNRGYRRLSGKAGSRRYGGTHRWRGTGSFRYRRWGRHPSRPATQRRRWDRRRQERNANVAGNGRFQPRKGGKRLRI